VAGEIDAASQPSEKRNPQAIAWYVEEAQRLLEDQQRRAESLRSRGGQIAGFGAAVLALIGGNATKLLDALDGCTRTLVGVALIAAAFCLAAAVAIAIWGALRPKIFAAISAEEITNYTSERFLTEPDLWRVHVRSLHALGDASASAQDAGNSAAKAIEWSLRTFLAGLAFSLLAIATLLVELI
jgi:hypothetical protein